MNSKNLKYNESIVSTEKINSYFFVVLILFIGNILLWQTKSPSVHIIIFWVISIILILLSKFNLLNPLMWFTGFFTLYSTAYAIVFVLFPQDLNYGYDPENIRLQFFAFTIFVLFAGRNYIDYQKTRNKYGLLNVDNYKDKELRSQARENKIIKLIMYCLIILVYISTPIFISRGYTHKSQVWENGDIFYRVTTHGLRFLVFYSCLLLLNGNGKIGKDRLIIFLTLVISLIFTMYSAERDAILRFLLMIILTIFTKCKIKLRSIIFLVPIGIIIMVLINTLKYYFIDGTITTKNIFSIKDLLHVFLNSDFIAPGSNLQLLIKSNVSYNFGVDLIITDIIGSVFPSGLFFNPSVWFNDTFFIDSSWNRAFTLVGEGYIIAGFFGVAAIFSIIGILNRILVRFSKKSYIGIAIYIYFIITTISSFRSTLGAMLTGLVRVPILSIIIFWLLKKVYISKNIESNFGTKKNV